MINIEKRLKEDLTIDQLLELLLSVPRDLYGIRGYILVPNDSLSAASSVSVDTIKYCREHELITVFPMGRKCSEFHITEKGQAFFNSRLSKEENSTSIG